jgi:ABC-type branched-subunit amino acid transport system substrate-binding protein
VIGPLDGRANEGASVITEHLHIPQIAYETIDRRLARQLDFPTFVRGIPVSTDFATTAAEYLQGGIWIRDYVGVIYDQSDYGEQFEDPMEDAEDVLGYKTKTEHVLEDDKESMKAALEECLSEGYHTIFFAADRPAILDDLAEVGEDLEIIGEDYVWFFTGDILPPELFSTTRFEVDSPADKVLRGAALLTNYDPFVYKPEGDAFLDAWKKQGDELLERLREMHPLDPSDLGYFAGEAGYFQEEVPTEYASFLYDAIMNAGMSACRSLESSTDHIKEAFKSDFQGASGRTSFKEGKNTRSTVGVKFGVYNVRPGPIDEGANTRG